MLDVKDTLKTCAKISFQKMFMVDTKLISNIGQDLFSYYSVRVFAR